MKKINTPKRSEVLAEFLGICFGDGCLSVDKKNHDYCLYFTGHAMDDKAYMEIYLPKIIKKLFNIEPKMRMQKGNTLLVYVRSKDLVNFLNASGMQIGKKNNLKIPEWIRANQDLMKAFLRGFADTDGSLTFKKRYTKIHYYPTISISSMNKILIEDSHRFLRKNGFMMGKVVSTLDHIKGYKSYPHFRIFLYGEENLEKWINLIGFSNMKHKSKYLLWKKLGYSPPHSMTQDRVKIIKNPPSEI